MFPEGRDFSHEMQVSPLFFFFFFFFFFFWGRET
jgi:hypothetical protein